MPSNLAKILTAADRIADLWRDIHRDHENPALNFQLDALVEHVDAYRAEGQTLTPNEPGE